MVNLFLDPFIFACPQPEQGFEQAEHYVNSILLWRELRETSWASIYISATTLEVLDQTESYPVWDFFNKFGKQFIQRKDVFNLINGLLNKLPTIEERLKIREILCDDMQCEPRYFLDGRHPLFIVQCQRLMAFMSLFCVLESGKDNDQILITRNLRMDKEIVKMNCDIVDCEFTDPFVPIQMPQSVSGSFPLCKSPHGLCLSANPITIWANCNDDADYHKALSLYLYQRIYESNSSHLEKKDLSWALGPNFIQTASDLGFLHEESKIKMLLRACAETILGEATRDVHAIRKSKSGSAYQKKRGVDEACRRDIDHEYHLHYWKTASGPVFTSVVVHSNISISLKEVDVQFASLVDYLPHLAQGKYIS